MAQVRTVGGACVGIEYTVLGMISNNVYFITDGRTGFVVDPSCKIDDIMQLVGGRAVNYIVLTHRHHDHVGAAKALRERTGACVVASAIDAPWVCGERTSRQDRGFEPCPVDRTIADGDALALGAMPWKVIGTPGHTPGSICLFLSAEDTDKPQASNVLISGDTLFCGSFGRTDFEGGDERAMRRSLKRLSQLPDDTIVLPGHESLTRIGLEQRRVFAYFC